jgi:hypothetical protein
MRGCNVGIGDGEFFYAAQMGLGAMIYVPSFIKIGSGIEKLIRRGTQTDTQRER